MKRMSSRRLEKGSQPLVYGTVPFILHVGKYQNTWTIVLASYVNSQAPDVPELAHRDIFQLSRFTVKKYSWICNWICHSKHCQKSWSSFRRCLTPPSVWNLQIPWTFGRLRVKVLCFKDTNESEKNTTSKPFQRLHDKRRCKNTKSTFT